jgi:hypothetical protein
VNNESTEPQLNFEFQEDLNQGLQNEYGKTIEEVASMFVHALMYLHQPGWYIEFDIEMDQNTNEVFWVFTVLNDKREHQAQYHINDVLTTVNKAEELASSLIKANPHYVDSHYLISVGIEQSLKNCHIR